MKKKQIALLMTGVLTVATLLAGCGGKEAEAPKEPETSTTEQAEAPETEKEADTDTEAPAESASGFTPENTITFNVSSKAGGNSDLITRTLTDICTKEGLV